MFENFAAGLLNFVPGAKYLGPLAEGLGGLFGSQQGQKHLQSGVDNIQNLPGMQGPTGIGGNFGQVSAGGQFTMDPTMALGQAGLAQSTGLMGGGLFNNAGFQQAFNQNDISGALGQANQAFGAQQGNTAFGQMGQLSQQLGNQFGQDYSGGLQGQLFGQGMANQAAAGNQSALFNQSLASQRAAAQPQFDRQSNRLQDQLFAKGLLGQNSTATGEAFRGLSEAQNSADLGFQNNAYQQAMQQQQFLAGLGGQQMGQGAGFLGQNLGQMNNTAQLMQGLEGQAFGQNLQANQFNTSQGMNRLQAAQGLFGQGQNIFSQNAELGQSAAQGLLGYGNLGLDAARSPQELQAALLQGSGQHGDNLSALAQQQADASSGFLGGIGEGLGKLFSDERLKDNVERIGSLGNLGWYKWTWNDKAQELQCSEQPAYGVLAQEVFAERPDAVSVDSSGYLKVDYSKIVGV